MLTNLPLFALAIAPLSYLLYLLGLCLYRLSPLHPLAKYPGPFLAKITPYYALYQALHGNTHLDIWRCHQKYGKFVRYSPDRLLVNSSRGLKDIFGHGKNMRKSTSYSMMIEREGWFTTVSVIDKLDHGRKRRLLSAGLSDSALREYETYALERIGEFCKQLGSKEGTDDHIESLKAETSGWSTAKNMSDWCNYLTFDIMSAVVFGKPFSMLDSKENRFMPRVIDNTSYRAGVYNQLPHKTHTTKKFLDKLLFPKSVMRGTMRFAGIAIAMANERVSRMKEKETGDVLSIVINSKDPMTGEGFSSTEIHAESRMLILAGSDTSSTGLAATFFYLSENKDAYDRLASEIRSKFSRAEEIKTGSKLSSCSYLRACIDESMRMTPPVPGALYREVLSGGAMVDGELLPAGYDAGLGSYSLHHDPVYFPEPFRFRPERWLSEKSEALDGSKAAFLPFQVGPRSCVGRAMAMMELTLAVARVIHSYDFRRRGTLGERKVVFEGEEYMEFKTEDHFASGKDGPMMEFKLRPPAILMQ